jgi:uncharacterized protein YeaO (DUF488 family)
MPEQDMLECHECGTEVEFGDAIGVNDYYDFSARFCADCVEECSDCGGFYRYLSEHRDLTCESCGDGICGNSLYHYCDECCEYRCGDCGRCECNSYRSAIHQWDWRPRSYRPKGEYPGQVLLGLELEVGGYGRDIVPAVQDIDCDEAHLYMKYDGSIDGVEIVTHPMTLDWASDFPFGKMLSNLRNANCYVDSDYGLHVHVSRNAFRRVGKRSASHQMAWLMFLYRNSSELEKLARRVSDQWASFKKPMKGELKRKAENPEDDSERYVAVNCRNSKTYELRFFKSTLQDQELWAALEFADASVEYTRGITTSDILQGSALSWDQFIEWAEGQKRDLGNGGLPIEVPKYTNLVAEVRRIEAEPPPRRRRMARLEDF